jgi:hypothetical protein
MNVGSMGGVMGSAAGAPLSQTAGSEAERTQKDASASQRQAVHEKKAADAAGIATTEEDQGASERDADGRRFWEASGEKKPDQADDQKDPTRRAKDPTGASGTTLDLTG